MASYATRVANWLNAGGKGKMVFVGLTERLWLGTFQTISSVSSSQLVVPDTYGFFVGQKVLLTKVGQDPLIARVRQVYSKTNIAVGDPDQKFSHRFSQAELSPYSGGSISADEQNRPSIADDVIYKAVYAEEPILALRTLGVDKYGTPFDSVVRGDGANALAVDATVSLSADIPRALYIVNQDLTSANTDYTVTFPTNTKKFTMKLRGDKGPLRIYTTSGGDFYTVSKGSSYQSDEIKTVSSLSLIVQSSQASSVLEVLYWI